MAVLAALYRDVRSAERHEVSLDGTLRDPEWKPYDVVVEDLSSTGFRIPVSADFELGAYVSLGLPGVGICPARVVRHSGDRCGCTFLVPLTDHELGAALTGSVLQPVTIGPRTSRPTFNTEADAPDAPDEQKLSLPARLRIIVGLAIASWAAAIWAGHALLAR